MRPFARMPSVPFRRWPLPTSKRLLSRTTSFDWASPVMRASRLSEPWGCPFCARAAPYETSITHPILHVPPRLVNLSEELPTAKVLVSENPHVSGMALATGVTLLAMERITSS